MYRSIKHVISLAIYLMCAAVAYAQSANDGRASSRIDHGADKVSPIFGIGIPSAYRRWELVAPSYRTDLNWIRAILGNPSSMGAYRKETLPFPDGAVLAKLGWKSVPSAELKDAVVPGQVTILEFMVKDSKKYPATGGWGFARFIDGKPDDEAQHQACFGCHKALVKGHDFVFTRYAP